ALIYPVTDVGLDSASMAEFESGFYLSRELMLWFWRHFVGGDPQGRGDDPELAPLRASDLGALPPSFVVTAGCDVLRDEGEALAAIAARVRAFTGCPARACAGGTPAPAGAPGGCRRPRRRALAGRHRRSTRRRARTGSGRAADGSRARGRGRARSSRARRRSAPAPVPARRGDPAGRGVAVRASSSARCAGPATRSRRNRRPARGW